MDFQTGPKYLECSIWRLSARVWMAVLCALAGAALASASTASAGVMAWGDNDNGQLGVESPEMSDLPLSLSGLGEATSVVASDGYSLALMRDGEVMAWGSNKKGTLGNGQQGAGTDVPAPVKGLSEVVAISSSHGYALALLADGEVMAWGDNKDGRLGNGQVGGIADEPVKVKGVSGAIAISASQFHSLALLGDGTVMGWGGNNKGELGTGNFNRDSTPVQMKNISEAVAVSAGNVHSLVLLRNGTVMSTGASEFGQLGDGKRKRINLPTPVIGLSEVTAISAGAFQNMALLSNGTVMTWGWNKSGELGNGSNNGPEFCGGKYGCAKFAIPVEGLSEVAAISAASNTKTGGTNVNDLVLLQNGTVMGWGGNEHGQLGDGNTKRSFVPIQVQGLTGVTAISAGGYHSLAVVPGA